MKFQILYTIATEDSVVVEYVSRGTHEGPLEGPQGILQPTHRKIEVPACDVYRISNGKISSVHMYWQTDVMLRQLGVLQSSQAAA